MRSGDTRTGEIAGVQYMRAIAAAFVVYFHTGVYNAQLPWPDWMPRGFGAAGVDMFFVISGFIMMLVTSGRPISPQEFLRRRVIRVVPLYWAVTLLLVVVGLALPNVMLENKVSLSHVLLSMAFLPHANPVTGSITPFFKLGWTLNYEMYFYVLFAVLLLLKSPGQRLAVLAAYAVTVSIVFLLTDPQIAAVRVYTNPIIAEFVFGCAVASLHVRGFFRRVPVAWAFALLVAGLVALVVLPVDDATRVYAQGLASVAVLCAVLTLEDTRRLPRLGWLLLLGNASYSIYLVHPLVESAVRVIGKGAHLPTSDLWVGTALVLLASVGSLAAGVLVHCFAEMPMLNAFKGGQRPRRPVAAMATADA